MTPFLFLAPVAYLGAVLLALGLCRMAARSDRRAAVAFQGWRNDHR